jgi:small GTP-binding protein
MSSGKPVSAKIILVGSSGVGKTSLVSCLFQQQFDASALPTVAPAFATWTVRCKDGTSVDLQIWDTAGQEQYQAISQMFYRDSDAALVCFTEGEVGSIPRWIERVKEHAPDSRLYLVATQVDLISEENYPDLNARAQESLETQKLKFFMTSAVSGQGVTDLFQTIAEESIQAQTAAAAPVVSLMDSQGPAAGSQKGCC